ncbi:MAG: ATP-dependent Clp protease ATP-binding subunit [Candidatus Schekmanbacteria bacterium]|nr:ATP-dependent Clp protease ATP-binding subunit [Candidatus Schekmanbacteria bacterium]
MTNIRMKYSERLDRFVKLRVYSDAEREKIFRGIRPKDGESYRTLIVQTTVVNYHDELLPTLRPDVQAGKIRLPELERDLYELCVAVNPELDIRNVSLEVADSEKLPPLYLVEAGAESGKMPVGEDVDLMGLEEELSRRVIGQPEAIDVVSGALRRAYAGLRDEARPIGTFLFIGQTGVGKTELAKAIAVALMGPEAIPVRIDCSEYAQPHEYAKLIGAPPGYVGHGEGGTLTEAIKAHPSSVVLFDEVEKAHTKVHNLLLQMMDDGVLTDSMGCHVAFGKCLIVLTSNVGAREVEALASRPGFRSGPGAPGASNRERSGAMRKALEQTFNPEFLNRIDEIVAFRQLGAEDVRRILELHLGRVAARLERLGVSITFSDTALAFLARRAINPRYGARPLLRAIKTWVESPLADRLLEGSLRPHATLIADAAVGADELTFRLAV